MSSHLSGDATEHEFNQLQLPLRARRARCKKTIKYKANPFRCAFIMLQAHVHTTVRSGTKIFQFYDISKFPLTTALSKMTSTAVEQLNSYIKLDSVQRITSGSTFEESTLTSIRSFLCPRAREMLFHVVSACVLSSISYFYLFVVFRRWRRCSTY